MNIAIKPNAAESITVKNKYIVGFNLQIPAVTLLLWCADQKANISL